MLDVLNGLITSKKAVVALATVIAWVVAKAGWQVDSSTLAEALSPLYLYIAGQALADHGKSAAEVSQNVKALVASNIDMDNKLHAAAVAAIAAKAAS